SRIVYDPGGVGPAVREPSGLGFSSPTMVGSPAEAAAQDAVAAVEVNVGFLDVAARLHVGECCVRDVEDVRGPAAHGAAHLEPDIPGPFEKRGLGAAICPPSGRNSNVSS